MSDRVTYSPRPGVIYSGAYEVREGKVYVTAQGSKGGPSQVGGSPPESVARMVLMTMVAKFRLTPDPT